MKKSILLILAILVLFLSIATVSATDLIVEKGNSDRTYHDGGWGNNNPLPSTHIIHLRVTNNKTDNTNAVNVWANFTWTNGADREYRLLDNANKSIGNISPGQTVDVFYHVYMSHPGNAAEGESRRYLVNISGSNTDSIQITGELRKRATTGNPNVFNQVELYSRSDKPTFGEFVTFTLSYTADPSNAHTRISPYIHFNTSMFRLINVTTVNDLNVRVYTSIVNGTILGKDRIFYTTWTLQAIGLGTDKVYFGIFATTNDPEAGAAEHIYRYGDPFEITVNKLLVDLVITKTVSNSTPKIGDEIIYTITVNNSGPNDATGVFVIDILPDGLEFIRYSTDYGEYNYSTGNWTIGNLSYGEVAILYITVKVTEAGEIINNATVTGNEEESDYTNNNASAKIVVLDEDPEDPTDPDDPDDPKDPEDPKDPDDPKEQDNPGNNQNNEPNRFNSEILVNNVRNNFNPEDDDSTDLTPVVLAESDDNDEVVVVENIPGDSQTEGTINNPTEARATIDQIPMQRTALPIAILILVLLAIFGIALPKIKQLK